MKKKVIFYSLLLVLIFVFHHYLVEKFDVINPTYTESIISILVVSHFAPILLGLYGVKDKFSRNINTIVFLFFILIGAVLIWIGMSLTDVKSNQVTFLGWVACVAAVASLLIRRVWLMK